MIARYNISSGGKTYQMQQWHKGNMTYGKLTAVNPPHANAHAPHVATSQARTTSAQIPYQRSIKGGPTVINPKAKTGNYYTPPITTGLSTSIGNTTSGTSTSTTSTTSSNSVGSGLFSGGSATWSGGVTGFLAKLIADLAMLFGKA